MEEKSQDFESPLVADHLGELGREGLRYQLIHKLGEGSYGMVWLAQQTNDRYREVAIKVLKHGHGGYGARSRFFMESRALARLNHPCIARVFETGVTTAQNPCIIMEPVKGLPLTHHCDASRLSIHERIELLILTATAVQHAHQNMIMHRDLKPGNILVTVTEDGRNMPKVIDFGLAKALATKGPERTLWTRTGEVIGTRDYMSPEQGSGNPDSVDVRSDVFALGAILHELLVGLTPLAAWCSQHGPLDQKSTFSTLEELPKMSRLLQWLPTEELLRLSSARATSPTQLATEISGDLEAVVRKACAPFIDERYASVGDLIADLKAWLELRPVSAMPPSTWYRMRKYAKRHRASVLVSVLLFAAFVAVVMCVFIFGQQAQKAEVVALQEKAMAEANRIQAEQAAKQAREALTDAEASTQLLLKALGSPLPGKQGRGVTVLQILEQAAESVRQNRDLSITRRSSLLFSLGSGLYAYAHYPTAADVLEESFRLRRLHNGLKHPNTLWAGLLLARSWQFTGRRPEAVKLNRQLLDFAREIKHPDSTRLVDTAREALGCSLYYMHEHEQAVALGRENVAYSLQTHGPEHVTTLCFMDELAANLDPLGKTREAMDILEKILPLLRTKMPPENPRPAIVAARLAAFYLKEGKLEQAAQLAEEARIRGLRIFGPNHGQTAFFTQTRLRALIQLAKYKEAEVLCDAWMESVEKSSPGHDEQLGISAEIYRFSQLLAEDQKLSACLQRMQNYALRYPAQRPQVKSSLGATPPLQEKPQHGANKPTLNLLKGTYADCSPGDHEDEVRSKLVKFGIREWQKSNAEVQGSYKLSAPSHPGLELSFRADGVLVRIRHDLTLQPIDLHPTFEGKTVPDFAASFGHARLEARPSSRAHVVKHQGHELRFMSSPDDLKLQVVSIVASFWKVP